MHTRNGVLEIVVDMEASGDHSRLGELKRAYYGGVTGWGEVLNSSHPATPYSHGLQGTNQPRNYLYVHILIALLLGLMALTLAYRWLHTYHAYYRRKRTVNGSPEVQSRFMHNFTFFWPWIKRHIVFAPLFKTRHKEAIRLSEGFAIGGLPTRYNAVLLVLYLGSNIAYCVAVDWHHMPPAALVAELRGRFGVLAAWNLIPTILFALRNNPLIPLLRISYDTFNLFHRWCARIMTLEALLHAIMWAINAFQSGGFEQVQLSLATSTSFAFGLLAVCAFATISLTAFAPLRHAFYETFIASHRILVLVGLIGTYIHLDKARLEIVMYIELCFLLWILEWVLRTFRIMYFNFGGTRAVTRISVQALPAEACLLTFHLSRSWRWKPGCHVHVYMPNMSLASSHPFSVAWVTDCSGDDEQKLPGPEDESLDEKTLVELSKKRSCMKLSNFLRRNKIAEVQTTEGCENTAVATRKTSNPVMKGVNASSVSLVVKAREGFTRHLYDKASAQPKRQFSTWGAIEGPYGGYHTLSSYGTVVLFAGGVGITHCIDCVHYLVRQYRAGTASAQKILLVWSVRDFETIQWISKWIIEIWDLLGEDAKGVLRIHMYVTRAGGVTQYVPSYGEYMQVSWGRCVPKEIVTSELEQRIGAVGVTVCGPGMFADCVRAATRSVMQEGCVDFIEEAFTT
ncbi:Ferric/cupric reductase transmembrane component 2 [Cercospora beticola]|uniref:Ferric/cupric reductase transmembrane component 2 n=1 Tax=Cercospora beticola TaxID=122368 RepID=A0A2G5I2R1_CERBT|nr:Ferric/cupric reductase transmembrane component 2 [Cercospora beticola]PIA98783.1 Ferric/cupric reductase transmembrane component 2 [Cercospora beticola]WPB00148.1 hypothetical protein RHO25_004767 [Cercospora beticola]CAK1361664.1 unnamed protein product [Cercospora beticola]